jgi:hypothetical protein
LPVSGQIFLNDQPFKPETGTTIAINFYPPAGGGLGIADVNDAGTYTASLNGKPGLPPGTYKVTVAITKPSNPKDEYSPPTSLINPAFADQSKTRLSIDVKEGGSYDLKVSK